jgi:hypothetical protein
MTLTAEDVRDLANVDPYLAGVAGLRDACKYSVEDIAIGAMPREIQFFTRAPAPGVGNMEKPNEVTFPLWITAIGLQIFGTQADIRIVAGGAGLVILKDNKEYESFPINATPGGGGLTMDYTPGIGAAVDYGTNGLDTGFFTLLTPIKMDVDQNIRGILRTNGEAVVAITTCMMLWRGLEEHPVL